MNGLSRGNREFRGKGVVPLEQKGPDAAKMSGENVQQIKCNQLKKEGGLSGLLLHQDGEELIGRGRNGPPTNSKDQRGGGFPQNHLPMTDTSTTPLEVCKKKDSFPIVEKTWLRGPVLVTKASGTTGESSAGGCFGVDGNHS